ncbi:MAG TPA: hypothetical protein VFT74_08925 [Isosphaeraceae bacterium]|nr:hypothetical protein [Isosphaeraceae bacterium]
MSRVSTLFVILIAASAVGTNAAEPLKVGVFSVDASPPVGSPLAYDPTKEVVLPLSCKGVVLMGEGKPVVLCAVDWIGIGNDGQTEFRKALADAVGTEPERVRVHTLHQHDAPVYDASVARVLEREGVDVGQVFDLAFTRRVISQASEAAKQGASRARSVSHLGLGEGRVEKVASNRRILGPDGKVQYVRYTACMDPKIRAYPEGTIDPMLKLISFWDGDEAIAVLTFYATHPQSYYRTGGANPDFPGMARDQREKTTGVPHIHFNGAGGNIGAGKYNDGSHENRQVLADRVAAGMALAWKTTRKQPISGADLGWKSLDVTLPPATNLDEKTLEATIRDPSAAPRARAGAARDLIWLRQSREGHTIDLSCLSLATARVLFMPGELFVEYQLAAQRMRPDLFVAMAAYGDYGPGYIGTEAAYPEGGYETGPGISLVAPGVEKVLMEGMKRLLTD